MTNIAQFRSGDPALFEELVRTHRPVVRSIVRRYLANEEDARDVVQLVFARAFEHRASFRGESTVGAWICRIAVNEALRHKQRPGYAQTESIDVENIESFTRELATSRLVAAELWSKVERYLLTLPPKQRLVVELRAFHDLPFAEIGEIAECGEASARVTYANGVKSLRLAFSDLTPSSRSL